MRGADGRRMGSVEEGKGKEEMNEHKCDNAGQFPPKAPVYHFTEANFLIFLIFFCRFVSSVSLFFPGYLPSGDWLKSSHVLVGGGLKVTLDLKPPLREAGG